MRPRAHQDLYKNVHKLMRYWFARLILEMDANSANAFKSNMHPEEFRTIRNHRRRMLYQEFRKLGYSTYEVRAMLDRTTPDVVKRRSNESNRRAAARWGGYPKAGTTAHNRWLMAR